MRRRRKYSRYRRPSGQLRKTNLLSETDDLSAYLPNGASVHEDWQCVTATWRRHTSQGPIVN